MTETTHLTKSKFTAGLWCPRLLWLDVHDPSPREGGLPGSPAEVGARVGLEARPLFPGGEAVDVPADQHEAARAETDRLMADSNVPAIFEATLEHDGIRIRVDVLERLNDGWGLREVKSSTSSERFLDDLAIQVYVAMGMGLDVVSAEIVHIDRTYTRGDTGVDWPALFKRDEMRDAVQGRLPDLPDLVATMKAVVSTEEMPDIAPNKWHCENGGRVCDHWARCTADKPDTWINNLYRIGRPQFDTLTALGIAKVENIPDTEINRTQIIMRDAHKTDEPFVSSDLGTALRQFGPPAFHLDFETMGPAIPLYADTRPYEHVPFQWSIHHVDADWNLEHFEYLAPEDSDPRRELAEKMLAVLETDPDIPILAYHESVEKGVIARLASRFPDLRDRLEAVRARVRDVLPLARNYTYFPGYKFGFSLKTVAPTLAPEISYEDLDGVSNGQDASAVFAWLAAGLSPSTAETAAIRKSLRAYCETDTRATVGIHRKLTSLAQGD